MISRATLVVLLAVLACMPATFARDVLTYGHCSPVCSYGYKCVDFKVKVCPPPVCKDKYICVQDPHAKPDCHDVQKCHDVVDKVCKKVDKQVCEPDTYVDECKKVPEEKCHDVPKQVCEKRKENVCKQVPEDKCHKVPVQKCHDVPDKKCERVHVCVDKPVKVCKNICKRVPRKVCRKVCASHGHGYGHHRCIAYKDVCKVVYDNQCHPVCHEVPKKECKFVDKCIDITKKVCKTEFKDVCKKVYKEVCHPIFKDHCYTKNEKVCKTVYKDVCHKVLKKGACKIIWVDVCTPITKKVCKNEKICKPVEPSKCPDHSVCQFGTKCELKKDCHKVPCKEETKYKCIKSH